MKKKIFLLILIFTLIFLFNNFYNHVNLYISQIVNFDKKDINIQSYKVQIEAKEFSNIEKNLSGLTYNFLTNTFFAISNRPRNIYELNKNGDIIRQIKLSGFKDTEGITHIKNDTFALVDEKKESVIIIKIDSSTNHINYEDSKAIKLEIQNFENFGFEGVTYNSFKNTILIANEKFPMKIIEISNWETNNPIFQKSEIFENIKQYVSDISSFTFNEKTNNFIILSDESKMILEVNQKGKLLSYQYLTKGKMYLENDIPQPEGITIDKENNIYIVSEPNLFYKFSK
ncbi:SdiA-regulated domain-containing protein [Arcobacter cloacae]|uniref:SdiA-regulated domain-containing protein n=1 Tax=Arcobacter cloacae TaxID=1054034 RepID=UPI0013E998CB|nr:SdiA-regulated domain-containing protein [Arcobacter cloacae]QKF89261.1 SdiA-regulated-like protein [Arcobacter cloacae]